MNDVMTRNRRLFLGLVLGGGLLLGTSAAEAADGVVVHILVLEAARSGKGIDARLAKAGLAKELTRLGYRRARVLDELNARVDRGARVSLQMPSRKQNLQVKLLQAKPADRQFRLELTIPEERFDMTTHHKDGGTVLIFLPPNRARPDIGLAVTPRR